jgi:hypothetical protein
MSEKFYFDIEAALAEVEATAFPQSNNSSEQQVISKSVSALNPCAAAITATTAKTASANPDGAFFINTKNIIHNKNIFTDSHNNYGNATEEQLEQNAIAIAVPADSAVVQSGWQYADTNALLLPAVLGKDIKLSKTDLAFWLDQIKQCTTKDKIFSLLDQFRLLSWTDDERAFVSRAYQRQLTTIEASRWQ